LRAVIAVTAEAPGIFSNKGLQGAVGSFLPISGKEKQ